MDGKRARVSIPHGMRRAARRELSTQLGEEVAGLVITRADTAYPVVAARIPIAGRGARHLLRSSAYAVALHQALTERGIGPRTAERLISDAVFASIRHGRDALDRVARLLHRDRLASAMWASDVARRFYYAQPDWIMKDVTVEDGFGMDVTRCVVAEFFDALGMGELCERAICDQDVRSAEHHGLALERSGTLAGGADRCDFRYHLPATAKRERSDRARPAHSPETSESR